MQKHCDRLRTAFLLLVIGVVLAACSNEEGFFRPVREEDEAPGGINITRLLAGETQAITQSSLPVNTYIWSAALETVDVLPVASADPFTGVIATDWGSSNASTRERFRVSVFVTSMELAVDSLRVSAFRQTNAGGQWVDAPIDPEIARQIEDAILLRARELRIAEQG
jgi:hypothetical protein